MSKQIDHIGKVVAVSEGAIAVWVERGEACANCQSQKSCAVMTDTNHTMTIKDKNYHLYHVGEEVNVSIDTSLGMKAVALAYIFPLLVLLLSLVVGVCCFTSELLQVAVALSPTVLYYIILYRFRRRIEQHFSFTVSKL